MEVTLNKKVTANSEISPLGKRKRIEQWIRRMIIKIANSFKIIFVIYITSLFAGGLAFALLENKSLGQGLWWAVVTALTVGYGDLSPVTVSGRIAATFFQHFWIYCMIPLIAVNLLTHVVRDNNQFSHEEQEWQEAALKAMAKKLGVELPPAPNDTNYTA